MRKWLIQMVAVVAAFTVLAVAVCFSGDSVAVVNPSGIVSIGGTLGNVDSMVVDIPPDQLSQLNGSSDSSESSEQSLSSLSSASSVAISKPDSSVAEKPDTPSQVPAPPIPSSSETPDSSGSEGGQPSGELVSVMISGQSAPQIYEASDILSQIVMAEMGPAFCDEALRAQTVAAHSYIKYYNNRGQAPVLPAKTPDSRIKGIVESVLNVFVCYNGEPISAVYGASTAGRTNDSRDVWGGYLPYLTSVESDYDYLDPNWGVQKVISVSEVQRLVKENTGIELSGDPSTWFQILNYNRGGYNGDMSIGGHTTYVSPSSGKTIKLTGNIVRENVLDWKIRSAKFDIGLNGDNFVFTTYGFGHGVGMSQWGAHYYATVGGYNYQQILTHYYPGTQIITK